MHINTYLSARRAGFCVCQVSRRIIRSSPRAFALYHAIPSRCDVQSCLSHATLGCPSLPVRRSMVKFPLPEGHVLVMR